MIEEAINYLRFIYSDRKDEGIGDDMPGQKAIQLGIEALEFKKTIFTRIEASLQWLVNDDGTWNWAKWEELKVGCRLPSEGEKE